MQSWSEKLNCAKPSQKKRLEKSIAGMSAGSLMYISTPLEIDEYIKKIPYGQSISVQPMRDDLAKKNGADCTCPLTTGIFLRIVAEAAFENINSGTGSSPTPFWRAIDPKSSIAKKLSFDIAFVKQKRDEESIA